MLPMLMMNKLNNNYPPARSAYGYGGASNTRGTTDI
jgi:hypothetical protein